uniref:Uncharacterized protein n=1 Tax=Romanomermis culicivorax TaxID=13658 RepID=A0A915L2D3_ROMCU
RHQLKLRKKLKFLSLIEFLSTSIVEQIFEQTIPEHNDFELHGKSTLKSSMMTDYDLLECTKMHRPRNQNFWALGTEQVTL